MKKTSILSVAILMAFASAVSAKESVLIDFTMLDGDMTVKSQDGEHEFPKNSRTIIDYGVAAGASFSDEQRDLMKTSLYLGEWEVELNASARNVRSLAESVVIPAPVRETSKQPFAGKNVMGVHVIFPEFAANANVKIVPPFEIPAYYPLSSVDENGDRQEQTDEEKASGRTLFEADDDETPAYGLVKNVGTLKAIQVTTMGENYPHKLYVMLIDTEGVTRRYLMGTLGFDGWKQLTWNNPNYVTEVRAREIRIYPIYPRGLPFVKFAGFQIVRDASHVGGDYIGYFKDVKIIYDKAELTTERDIAEEDLWGIITYREGLKQNAEMARFGDKQVNRYIEQEKMATEQQFTDSLSNDASSNAQENGQQDGGSPQDAN